MIIEEIIINKKKIYIFENHNEAIIPWNNFKSLNKPALLTFDYHTDTHLALLRYNANRLNNYNDYQLIKQETNKILSIKPINILEMVKILHNDEHIDFAIRANIISHAYVCSTMTSINTIKSEETKLWEKDNNDYIKILTNTQSPKPIEHTFKMPENKIIELDKEHFNILGIDSEKEQADLAIDDTNLKYRILKIEEISKSIFGNKYNFFDNFILDIDLDYFNTLNSIYPENIQYFYFLIQKAKFITIAKESFFVKKCSLEQNKITVEIILNRIIDHIHSALK